MNLFIASTCAWCQKLGVRSFTLRTDNDDAKTLCSEVCFNQYRRASFKKNKVRFTHEENDSKFKRFCYYFRVPSRTMIISHYPLLQQSKTKYNRILTK